MLASAFFSCLSICIAGIVLTDRLMGIGQAITMPLFFGSNALRGLLIGAPSHLPLDFGVLAGAAVAGIAAASALLGWLAK